MKSFKNKLLIVGSLIFLSSGFFINNVRADKVPGSSTGTTGDCECEFCCMLVEPNICLSNQQEGEYCSCCPSTPGV